MSETEGVDYVTLDERDRVLLTSEGVEHFRRIAAAATRAIEVLERHPTMVTVVKDEKNVFLGPAGVFEEITKGVTGARRWIGLCTAAAHRLKKRFRTAARDS